MNMNSIIAIYYYSIFEYEIQPSLIFWIYHEKDHTSNFIRPSHPDNLR